MESLGYLDDNILVAYHQKLALTEDFWQGRFAKDFGIPPRQPTSWYHSYLSCAKKVWMVGNNQAKFFRQVLIFHQDSTEPIGPLRANQVSIGSNYSLVVTPNFSVWYLSSQSPPQPLVLNDQVGYAKKVAVGRDCSVILDLDDRIWQLKAGGQLKEIWLPERGKVEIIAAGRDCFLFLDMSGKLWVIGSNLHGQLGLGDTLKVTNLHLIPLPQVTQIACGRIHTLLLDRQGHLWASGNNKFGQLGLGDRINRNRFTLVVDEVHQVAAGKYHSVIVDRYHHLLTFGRNNHGQLGLDHLLDQTKPTLVLRRKKFRRHKKVLAKTADAGDDFTAFLDFAERLWVFGRNHRGQLGLGDKINRKVPTLAPSYSGTRLACGGKTLCLYS